jgi:hypothetical protein
MRILNDADKAELEYQESTIDNIYHDIDLGDLDEEQKEKLNKAYFEFRDVFQESIRKAFPEGTKFGSF